MKTRTFGVRWRSQASLLGFGTMRLPVLDGDLQRIDEEAATDMLRTAVAGGVNYVDTAYPYHGGESERWLGRALQTIGRDRVLIADKMPTWMLETQDDFDRLFDEQLERLQVDRIDVYLLHNLQEQLWPKVASLDPFAWLDRVHASGRVGAVGFSFHGGYELFEELVDAYPWDMCQIQYNYMNEDVQAGTRGLHYAAGKGLSVVVMEPLLGGCLADLAPEAEALCRNAGHDPVALALRWLWDKPETSVVLSGMSTMEQVQQNLQHAEDADVGCLEDGERQLIDAIRTHYRSLDTIPCTRCGYCMPCPTGVDIPRSFQLYNDTVTFQGNQVMLNGIIYRSLTETLGPKACVRCGACLEKCPQSIEIPDMLDKVDRSFAS